VADTFIDRDPGDCWTSVNNGAIRDKRLALDEKGFPVWLLSLPHDWKVIQAHVQEELGIGKDLYQRLVRNLKLTGYVEMKIVRAPDGPILSRRMRVGSIPVTPIGATTIQEPAKPAVGPNLQEASPSQLQKKESNKGDLPPNPPSGDVEAASPSVFEEDQDPSTTALAEPVAPPEVPASSPEIAKPKVECPVPESGPAFDALVKAYAGPMLSRPETERAWRSLSATERQAAIDGVAWYVADCAAQKPFARAVRDLKHYLRGKVWEGAKAAPVTAVPILGGTAEAAALLEAERAAGRPTAFIEDQWRQGKAYYARTQWPAGYRIPGACWDAPPYRPPAEKRTAVDVANDLIADLDRRIDEAEAREADDAGCLTVTYSEVIP
jgi:hypothetical protein